jgi:hypothetical protein
MGTLALDGKLREIGNSSLACVKLRTGRRWILATCNLNFAMGGITSCSRTSLSLTTM